MKKIYLIVVVLFLSCQFGSKDQYFDSVAENDTKLQSPLRGEWRYEHDDKRQSFEEFTAAKPIKPVASKNTIYLKPIGNFTGLQRRQIELTKEYLEIFYQLKVETAADIPNEVVPKNSRRIGNENNEQLLARYILDSVLIRQKPKDAIVMMGISELDLYPSPDWNYVFGLASFKDKVGVSSIFRLQDNGLTPENFNLCLTRLLKVSSHEIGHMFSLHHCVGANCVMNGTNHIPETDKHVSRLCSHCQRKLHSTIKYDSRKRLVELIAFFKKTKLDEEAVLLRKDLESID